MENRGKRQSAPLFGGTGFYIALLACVLAAGALGYFALSDPTADSAPVTEAPPVSVREETPPIREALKQQPITVSEPDPQPKKEDTIPPQQAPVMAAAPQPAPEVPADDTVMLPLEGETAAAFSVARLVYDPTQGDWRTHDGIDIRGEEGAAVVSAAAGTVRSVTNDPRLGTTVVIDHGNGYTATYAGLQQGAAVLAGDTVTAGQTIGAVGTTALSEAALGPHLHFAVTLNGETVDPAEFLG